MVRVQLCLSDIVETSMSKKHDSYIVCACYRKGGEPPLIKGWIPFLGKALEFRKNSQQFLSQLQQEHGDVFTVLIAGTSYKHTRMFTWHYLYTIICFKNENVS